MLATHFGVMSLLSLYGLHRAQLIWLYLRRKPACAPVPAPPEEELPSVTVQLPIYNERFVVEGLIDSVCRLDYPADRLEIQVLDDSTDDTSRIAEAAVERAAALGRARFGCCAGTAVRDSRRAPWRLAWPRPAAS